MSSAGELLDALTAAGPSRTDWATGFGTGGYIPPRSKPLPEWGHMYAELRSAARKQDRPLARPSPNHFFSYPRTMSLKLSAAVKLVARL